jgi:hypothetical protein
VQALAAVLLDLFEYALLGDNSAQWIGEKFAATLEWEGILRAAQDDKSCLGCLQEDPSRCSG